MISKVNSSGFTTGVVLSVPTLVVVLTPVACPPTHRKENELRKDISKGYNEYKEFEERKYTGMRVGGTHEWYYDKGEWKEKKITPDKWKFNYSVKKTRAGHAPEGSGVPVGTEYHWYILAD